MGFEEKLTYYAEKMAPTCRENDSISDELFTKYGVYRGLRDLNGKGVVTGLTNISKIVSVKEEDEKSRDRWRRSAPTVAVIWWSREIRLPVRIRVAGMWK